MLQIKTVLPIPLFHSSDASSSYTKQRHHPDVQSDIDMDMDEPSYNYAELDPEESGALERQITTPGEVVTSAKEFMRGHGTLLDASGENVVATVAGTVERVNKLVSVKSVKSSDLVYYKVKERRSTSEFPGGMNEGSLTRERKREMERRKVESDALKMREFLAEGDLLVAEVQSTEGMIQLHTRSLKYGKLRNGQLTIVPASLIRRLKSHFYTLPPPCGPQGVDVILGVNGYIWVCLGSGSGGDKERTQGSGGTTDGFDNELVYSDKNDIIPPPSRQAISRVCALIQTFARYSIPLTETLLMSAYEWCRHNGLEETGVVLSRALEKQLLEEIVGIVDTDE
ncbi:hypothetical protein QFC21_006610 [Naganishia friedmannii]|uniref:Uncharacterized protein n=1 Tax=Naganishia friedmannii TaxID=89922 RepID=A0ACC2V1D6_9TREE|nr:hypothetical protein QFC21_006610 [Naganishia friedmannii]